MRRDAIERLAGIWRGARAPVALTGAGISTESGIPDFRGPGGVWSRYRPVEYGAFLRDEEARAAYWRYKRETFPAMARARPNAGHRALAALEAMGALSCLFTQNIDGLHRMAGSRRVIELHGTERVVLCLSCDRRHDREVVQGWLEEGIEVPRCEDCGGLLKPATISFGQGLDPAVLAEAFDRAGKADVFLAVGSSLTVHPAAQLPLVAKEAGAVLAILNAGETALDPFADWRSDARAGEGLPALVEALRDAAGRDKGGDRARN